MKYLQIPQISGSADTDPVLCRRFKKQNKNQKPTAIKKKKKKKQPKNKHIIGVKFPNYNKKFTYADPSMKILISKPQQYIASITWYYLSIEAGCCFHVLFCFL